MNNQPSSLENTELGAAPNPLDPKRALSAEALQRRRMLLKGAGGGGAALAAMTPLSALAGGNQLMFCKNKTKTGNVIATVSGVQSAAASFASRQMTEAGGCSPANWGAKSAAAWPCDPNTKVNTVVGWAGKACSAMSLVNLMKTTAANCQTERHWACAYINAMAHQNNKLPAAFSFPYSPLEVKMYIANQDSKAYSFFTGYMETL